MNFLDDEYFEDLPKNIIQNLRNANLEVLAVILNRIKYVGELNEEDTAKLSNALEFAGADLKIIEKILAEVLKTNIEEITKIFEKTAKDNVNFANTYYKYRGLKELQSYKDNEKLVKLVESIKRQTEKDFKNISKTTGFMTDGKFKTIREQYIQLVDEAITSVTTGTLDFQTAVKSSVKKMVDSGLRTVDFETGYSRRIDSQLKLNILEGVSKLNEDMLIEQSKEYGADGVEITAHGLCAPDHQHIQGKQFTNEEFEKLNKKLDRPIGTLNCRHKAIPVIIGVSRPAYSKKDLQEITKNSNKKVEYGGKTYTKYEASQQQRRLETEIRKQNDLLKSYKILGNKEQIKKINNKIKENKKLYKEFSESVGLTQRPENFKI